MIDVEERARELVTMAAHDLRSPLAVIKWSAAAITERCQNGSELTPHECVAVVNQMCRAADDAFSMIDDLLALERLQDRCTAPHPIADVEAVVAKAIAREREALGRARCSVTVVRQKGLDQVRGPWDRVYLLRVFGNLLRNAATHAPGAPVQISLARRGAQLAIVFADHGPGLPDRHSDEHDASGHRQGGSGIHGLGLWIVRRSIERMGGRMSIRRSPGHGAAFDIELPWLGT